LPVKTWTAFSAGRKRKRRRASPEGRRGNDSCSLARSQACASPRSYGIPPLMLFIICSTVHLSA
jgi:hypothetical protein